MAETNSLLESIVSHPLINKMIDDLTFNQFYHERLKIPAITIKYSDIRKAIWLTSILASSDFDEHRNKAQILASLLYLQNPEDTNIGRAVYVLFSRIGNLTGAGLLKCEASNYGDLSIGNEIGVDAYDASLMLELALERAKKTISSNSELIMTTRFQKNLWDQLYSNDKIIISAPTSSGKSFIIKKFLKAKIAESEEYISVYIVPSRALLNQVSEDLRNEVDLEHVSIKTVFINEDIEDIKHKIFILTPERCLKLLKYRSQNEFKIDLIFIDEVQNVEDTQGRGALFEFVFKELFTLFPSSKIIAAGPNIKNPENLFENVFGLGGQTVETLSSPVFQIKTTIKPIANNQLEITASSLRNTLQTYTLQTETDYVQKFKASTGEGLKHLITLCGHGQQNIIYSPKGNWAAEWALKFASTLDPNERIDPWLKEIIEFLSDEIHPMYHLIPCLTKETAYHHGNLPDIVRKEIEDCFIEGKIKHLFCTSTLLQGVNLPANNLFIPMPKKRHMDLTPFDFGNLIGRAGRIRDSLYGTIFCIERKENEEWSQELYTKSHQKAVQTAGEKSLERLEDFFDELEKTVSDINHETDRSAVVFFRQKYAQNPEELRKYLVRYNLPEEDIQKIQTLLELSLSNLTIPSDLVKQNPTIDPILQNNLYEQIKSQGIENWLIPSRADNKNTYTFQTEVERDNLPFELWNFYWQLADLIQRLDEIFFMTQEAFYKHSVSVSVKQISFYARQWLGGKSLRQLISSDIKFYSNHSNPKKKVNPDNAEDVNDRINKVIKLNSVVTTHILIKYMKLINDLAEPFLTEQLKEKYKFALALPTMLELGTTEPAVVGMISRGISRSIALKIFSEFKKIYNYEEMDIFRWLSAQETLKLKPIYNRYLKRMRLLKE
ncbi:DEAD/DEAH box helicase [Pedobacter panaciterrae]